MIVQGIQSHESNRINKKGNMKVINHHHNSDHSCLITVATATALVLQI